MSIRGAILGLLAEGPMTGYEVAKRFEHSLARVWPARSNQIYTEMNRMADAGLIEEIGREARNARRYAITKGGRTALTEWMLRPVPPEQALRFEPLLKANFAWTLPEEERRAWLAEQRRYWTGQIAWLDAQAKHLPPGPEGAGSDPGESDASAGRGPDRVAAPSRAIAPKTAGAMRAAPDRRRAAAAGRAIYQAMRDWAGSE